MVLLVLSTNLKYTIIQPVPLLTVVSAIVVATMDDCVTDNELETVGGSETASKLAVQPDYSIFPLL